MGEGEWSHLNHAALEKGIYTTYLFTATLESLAL